MAFRALGWRADAASSACLLEDSSHMIEVVCYNMVVQCYILYIYIYLYYMYMYIYIYIYMCIIPG